MIVLKKIQSLEHWDPAEGVEISQSEIYREIFDNYGGASGKMYYNYRGHYVGEVQV